MGAAVFICSISMVLYIYAQLRSSLEVETYMKDLIIKMFNLEPDSIEDISCSTCGDHQFVQITLIRTSLPCPFCKRYTTKVHDYRQCCISHSIIYDMDTTIVYNKRRYSCPSCKRSFSKPNPFADPGKRISRFTVMQIMKLLRNPEITFEFVAKTVRISKTSVIRIFDSHAGIQTRTLPACLCIDEVYQQKFQRKEYACVLVDMISSQIYDLLPSRRKGDLGSYFSAISKEERARVQYICMDMWDPYREIAATYFPKATICVDSFHVIQAVNRAFTGVRRRVMNEYPSTSDEYYLLKHYSWLLDQNYRKVDLEKILQLHRTLRFFDGSYINARWIIEAMCDLSTELSAAYLLKYKYEYLNYNADSKTARSAFEDYLDELSLYRIPEFRKLSRTLKKWKLPIIASFNTYEGRRISNGPVESVNSRIKRIKRNASGYGNFDRFRRRVLYSLNDGSSIVF